MGHPASLAPWVRPEPALPSGSRTLSHSAMQSSARSEEIVNDDGDLSSTSLQRRRDTPSLGSRIRRPTAHQSWPLYSRVSQTRPSLRRDHGVSARRWGGDTGIARAQIPRPGPPGSSLLAASSARPPATSSTRCRRSSGSRPSSIRQATPRLSPRDSCSAISASSIVRRTPRCWRHHTSPSARGSPFLSPGSVPPTWRLGEKSPPSGA